jgi:hypothetical protein
VHVKTNSTADDDGMSVVGEVCPHLSQRIRQVRHRARRYGGSVILAIQVVHSGHKPIAPSSVEPL